MFRFITIAIFGLWIGAATSGCAQSFDTAPARTPVSYDILTGYFFKNSNRLPQEIGTLVLKNAAEFNHYIGVARTMQTPAKTADFSKTHIALVGQPTQMDTKITVNAITRDQNIAYIDYSVLRQGMLTYQMRPMTLIEINTDGITDFRFNQAGEF
ncbi:MAG: hypothetical protein LBU87_02860 [Lactobacillales bacterium]|jgi:hypothetical protein|nr:hypothetical protein [Lactobacillales bacterium]